MLFFKYFLSGNILFDLKEYIYQMRFVVSIECRPRITVAGTQSMEVYK